MSANIYCYAIMYVLLLRRLSLSFKCMGTLSHVLLLLHDTSKWTTFMHLCFLPVSLSYKIAKLEIQVLSLNVNELYSSSFPILLTIHKVVVVLRFYLYVMQKVDAKSVLAKTSSAQSSAHLNCPSSRPLIGREVWPVAPDWWCAELLKVSSSCNYTALKPLVVLRLGQDSLCL